MSITDAAYTGQRLKEDVDFVEITNLKMRIQA